MKHSSAHKSRLPEKVILTWSERITPGVPAKAVNYSLMEENKELRDRIKALEEVVSHYSAINNFSNIAWQSSVGTGRSLLVAPELEGEEAIKVLKAAGILDEHNKLHKDYQ